MNLTTLTIYDHELLMMMELLMDHDFQVEICKNK